MHPDFAEWIASRSAPDDPDAPLFTTLAAEPQNGEYGLSNTFVKLMGKAGIVGKRLRIAKGLGRTVNSLSFHSLRHTAVSTTFNRAMALDTARKVSGHAKDGSIEKYAHIDTESIRSATRLIPRLPKGI